MSSGMNWSPSCRYAIGREPVTVGPDGLEESHVKMNTSPQMTVENLLNQANSLDASDPANEQEWPSLSASGSSGAKGRRRTRIDLGTQLWQRPKDRARDSRSLQHGTSFIANSTSHQDGPSLPTRFGKKHMLPSIRKSTLNQTHPAHASGNENSACVKGLPVVLPFDICLTKSRNSAKCNASLYAESRDYHNELEHSKEEAGQVLRPGMILLKNYLALTEQVETVKKCQELGLGPGGFYQPGYQDGAKLRLQMMCLGLNWDPQTRKYEDRRLIDGSKPPGIPHEFSLLVKRAMTDSHDLLKKHCRISDAEDIIPQMSPDICIVNFYGTSGRLGLHQDRDEGKESLHKGLPVVSFSVGDTAEFLYGDQREVDKAEKVLLESGDVLIFGGKARHIFHGVLSIIPNSAPRALLEETNLRPGRLNLTFRQF
ncbi:unnamed protein product [Ilex paraguariensis]|uniref:DNA N(6)-methyladenine demethylase n=1 Tax=Ilex paraguariensis TaxID=185542 RepID=A0ABC8RJC3_9AQUA